MRVLVCGSRDWDDEEIIWMVLSGVRAHAEDDVDVVVIEGEARGADCHAKAWAQTMDVPYLPFPADWNNRPRWKAGPERNQRMLDEGEPDVGFAFKNNFNWKMDRGGTEDMVRRAKAADVPVYVVSRA